MKTQRSAPLPGHSKKRTHCGDRPNKTKALLPAFRVFSEPNRNSNYEKLERQQALPNEPNEESKTTKQTQSARPQAAHLAWNPANEPNGKLKLAEMKRPCRLTESSNEELLPRRNSTYVAPASPNEPIEIATYRIWNLNL
jgi:hypothetical protein